MYLLQFFQKANRRSVVASVFSLFAPALDVVLESLRDLGKRHVDSKMNATNCLVTCLPFGLSQARLNNPFSTHKESHLAHNALKEGDSSGISEQPGRSLPTFFRLTSGRISLSSSWSFLHRVVVHSSSSTTAFFLRFNSALDCSTCHSVCSYDKRSILQASLQYNADST